MKVVLLLTGGGRLKTRATQYIKFSCAAAYEKGKTRSTANFDSSELEGLKDELNQPTIKPAFVSTEWVRMIALGSFDFFRKTNLVVKIPINELYP